MKGAFSTLKDSYTDQVLPFPLPKCLCIVKLCKAPTFGGKLLQPMKPNCLLTPPIPHWQLQNPQIVFGRAAEISSLIFDSFTTVMINPLGVLCKMGDLEEGREHSNQGKHEGNSIFISPLISTFLPTASSRCPCPGVKRADTKQGLQWINPGVGTGILPAVKLAK